MIPDIHKIKEILEENGMKNSKVEKELIDAINNDIQNVLSDNKNKIKYSLKDYKMIIYNIENKEVKVSLEKNIKNILSKINRFELEYLNKF
ncbi:MAG: hypothetical protein ACOC1O_02630 [bacterium]